MDPVCVLFASSILLLAAAVGCRTAPPIPKVNLNDPGWSTHEGQAVWRLPQGKSEIAGDVLAATRVGGQAFVQFSKTPFSLIIAQLTPTGWEAEFPPQHRHYSGTGAPPQRLIWLYLPLVLAGKPPPPDWTWTEDSNGWRLENHRNGESLQGYFIN